MLVRFMLFLFGSFLQINKTEVNTLHRAIGCERFYYQAYKYSIVF